MRGPRWLRVAAWLLVLMLGWPLPVPRVWAQEGAVLRLAPERQPAVPGQEVAVEVVAERVEGLYAYELELRYDPAVLQFVSAAPGQALAGLQAGSQYMVVASRGDGGSALFALTLLGDVPPLTAAGGPLSLAVFRFRVAQVAEGTAGTLEIVESKLAGRDGAALPVAAREGARVVVDLAPPSLQVSVTDAGGRERPAYTGEIRITVTASEPLEDLRVEVAQKDRPPVAVTMAGDAAGTRFTGSHRLLAGADGPAAVRVNARDRSGRTATAERSILVDTTPPVLTLEPLPPVTSATSLTAYAASSEALAVAQFEVDDTKIAAAAAGERRFTATLALAEGRHAVRFSGEDAAGNAAASASAQVVVDRTPPEISVDSLPAGLRSGATVNLSALVTDRGLAGVAADTVQVFHNGVRLEATVAPEGDGFRVRAQAAVAEGRNEFEFRARDLAGNRASRSVVLDANPPRVTAALDPASPDGTAGWYRTAPRLVLTASDPQATLWWRVNGGAEQRYAGPVTLPDGTPTVVEFWATSSAYPNPPDQPGLLEVYVDTRPPAPVSGLRLADGGDLDGAAVRDKQITVEGQAEAGATVRVYRGDALVSEVRADVAGAFSATVPLLQGDNALRFEVVDAAGNRSDAVRATVIRDAVGPVFAIEVTPPEAAGGRYRVAARANEELDGEPAATARVRSDSGVHEVPVQAEPCEGGEPRRYCWSFPDPGTAGTLEVLVTGRDRLGNEGTGVWSQAVVATARDATVAAGGVVMEIPAGTLAAETARVSITTDPDATPPGDLDVVREPVDLTADAAIAEGKALTVAFQLPCDTTAEAAGAMGVYRLDEANRVWVRQPSEFVAGRCPDRPAALRVTLTHLSTYAVLADREPPPLAVAEPAEGAWVNGVTVVGTTEPGAVVRVEGGTSPREETAGADGSFRITVPTAEGPVSLRITARDAAGNVTVVTRTVRVDRTPPSWTLRAPLQESGSGDASHGVQVRARDVRFDVQAGDDGSGVAGIELVGGEVAVSSPGAALSYGLVLPQQDQVDLPVRVRIADRAGNASTVTVRLTGDLFVTFELARLRTDRDARVRPLEAGTFLVARGVTAVAFEGTAEPGARISFAVGGQSVEAQVAAAGVFRTPQVALPPDAPSLVVAVTAVDAAGNRRTEDVVIHRTGPDADVPLDVAPLPERVEQARLAVRGTTLPGALVVVRRGEAAEVEATADAAGSFAVELDLIPGENRLRVWAEDAYGNVSAAVERTVTYQAAGGAPPPGGGQPPVGGPPAGGPPAPAPGAPAESPGREVPGGTVSEERGAAVLTADPQRLARLLEQPGTRVTLEIPADVRADALSFVVPAEVLARVQAAGRELALLAAPRGAILLLDAPAVADAAARVGGAALVFQILPADAQAPSGGGYRPVADPVRLELGVRRQGGAVEPVEPLALARPAVLGLAYRPERLSGLPTWTLGVYRRDEATGAWVFVGGRVREDERRVYAALRGFSAFAVLAYHRTFADVQAHWAREDVERMAAHHVVRGVGGDRFLPDGQVTRAQFAAMLVRALGLPLANPTAARFADVPREHWAFREIETAVASGIVSGLGEGRFAPEAPITREQVASMVARALARVDRPLPGPDREVLARFRDADGISPWARGHVAAAVAASIFRGRSPDLFAPAAPLTRAEAAAIVRRVLVQAGRY